MDKKPCDRDFNCENYDLCLDKAAKDNRKFYCQDCDGNPENVVFHKASFNSLPKEVIMPIKRTTQGLAFVLFDEIDALREGKSSPPRANSIAALSKYIVAIKRLELDITKYGKNIQPRDI